MQGLRDYAGGRGIGGLDVPDFDRRRAELASLLNTLRQSPNAEVRQKATALGARLAILRPAGSTAAALRQQADNRRWLERVRLEITLQTSREGVTPAPTPVRETEFARSLLEQNRALLATLDAAAGAPPVPDAERKSAGETLNNLLAPCLKCHLFDGEDEGRVTYFPTPPDPAGLVKRDSLTVGERQGLRLAPVSAAEPVMKRAVFSHRPHLTATSCVTCHGSVINGERPVPAIPGAKTVGSTLAIDLNSPGVGYLSELPQVVGRTAGLRRLPHLPPGVSRASLASCMVTKLIGRTGTVSGCDFVIPEDCSVMRIGAGASQRNPHQGRRGLA